MEQQLNDVGHLTNKPKGTERSSSVDTTAAAAAAAAYSPRVRVDTPCGTSLISLVSIPLNPCVCVRV